MRASKWGGRFTAFSVLLLLVGLTVGCEQIQVAPDPVTDDGDVIVTADGKTIDKPGPDATVCQPACASKECGDDGCGGTCAPGCTEAQLCTEEQLCQARPCTAGQPFCDGDTLYTCNADGTGFDPGGVNEDCSLAHEGQGACEAEDWDENDVPETAACVCVPACDDKVCGDDGCGGVCGTCDDGTACEEGACRNVKCTPGSSYCFGDDLLVCNDFGTDPDADTPPDDCGDKFDNQGACEDTDDDDDGIAESAACVCVPACDGAGCWEDSGCADEEGEAIMCWDLLCEDEEDSCHDLEAMGITEGDGCLNDFEACWDLASVECGTLDPVNAEEDLDCAEIGLTCAVGTYCADGGNTCLDACAGIQCGLGVGDYDGCGSCEDGDVCDETQQCVSKVCEPDLPYCFGDDLLMCNGFGTEPDAEIPPDDCGDKFNSQGACGNTDDDGDGIAESFACVCVPACADKSCDEADGCGGTCDAQLCDVGESESCWPTLLAAEGAGDGCFDAAGACGLEAIMCGDLTSLGDAETIDCGDHTKVCDDGWTCNDANTCDCVPACEGKICGEDHCGTKCGELDGACAGPQDVCTDEGQCECVAACDDVTCGQDGCGGLCDDTCGEGDVCDEPNNACLLVICVPGELYCEDTTTLAKCNTLGAGSDDSVSKVPCTSGDVCDSGACAAVVCEPGEPWCNGDIATTCNALGTGAADGATEEDCSALADDVQLLVTCVLDDADATACECQQQCDGKECGTDSCGSVCGTCGDSDVCDGDQQCVTSICEPDLPYCDGEILKNCDAYGAGDTGAGSSNCALEGDQFHCLPDGAGDQGAACGCVPACTDKACNVSDGCGDLCSTTLCEVGESCWPGVLGFEGAGDGCLSDADACGLTAVECGTLQAEGAAGPTECAAHGKSCGDGLWCDGAAHTCIDVLCEAGLPYCETDEITAFCNEHGTGSNNGLAKSNCSLEPGMTNCSEGYCVCTPYCPPDSCLADDGCGGLCNCPGGDFCYVAESACIPCEKDGWTCFGEDVLASCDDKFYSSTLGGWFYDTPVAAFEQKCSEAPADSSTWACVPDEDLGAQCACVPNCGPKECGPDGCGGTCGEGCSAGETCHFSGLCQACEPQCDGKSCGSDGCGGTCGICDDGDPCTIDSCDGDACSYGSAAASLGLAGHISVFDAQAVALDGGLAAVASGLDGVAFYDVTNPQNPVEMGTHPGETVAYDIAVEGGYAYVSDPYFGLYIIDVTDPTNPTEASAAVYYPGWGMPQRLHLDDPILWTADIWTVTPFKMSDPSDLTFFSGVVDFMPSSFGQGDNIWDMYVLGHGNDAWIFTAFGGGGLLSSSFLELEDDRSSHTEAYKAPNSDVRAVTVEGGVAYLVDRGVGLVLVDITKAPQSDYDLLSTVEMPPGGVIHDALPQINKGDFETSTWVYVAAGPAGLLVVDTTDPQNPVIVATYPEAAGAIRVAADEQGTILVARGAGGVDVLTEATCCVPDCSNKSACAGDGCGAICGDCVDPDAGFCSGAEDGSSVLGGACCNTETCGSADCRHAQCPSLDGASEGTEGWCYDGTSPGFCTDYCELGTDLVNNATGAAVPDGVTDPDQPNPCAGYAHGPLGGEFHCVKYSYWYGTSRCQPGTTFAECSVDDDCPSGEFCRELYSNSEYSSRCQPAILDAADLGEACNADPAVGLLKDCNSGAYCHSYLDSCQAFCNDNNDCATNPCDGGVCAKDPSRACSDDSDCGPLYCVHDSTIFNDFEYSEDVCWPVDCEKAGDCADPDWYCDPIFSTSLYSPDADLRLFCRVKPEEAHADYGEPCGETGDGTGLPPCLSSYSCMDNVCSAPCKSQDHCEPGTLCRLAMQVNLTTDYVNVEACGPWPSDEPEVECFRDDDCSADHHCRSLTIGEGDEPNRTFRVTARCHKNTPDTVGFGASCSDSLDAECGHHCLFSSGATVGLCTERCNETQDCPAVAQWNGQGYSSYCRSYARNKNETLDPLDDLYSSYCWLTSLNSSRDSCETDRTCADTTEMCYPSVIGGHADTPVVVEHVCLDAAFWGYDPNGVLGTSCSSHSQCRSGQCRDGGANGYFCTETCATDADCANNAGLNLKCTAEILLERPNPANNGVTKRCALAPGGPDPPGPVD